ncbi:hypothetical protein [Hymenobacter sp. BT190]|uniref:hypothetical protein n=1 Tax=Hymenobacter sp. BT190 TaxID=2763505 RepID=UPI0016518F09|nr:hypothetical protein [Hymenobacter sp. BT190]MBC6700017.1 hypothetical protein [Hymenobacter sp. BT190]
MMSYQRWIALPILVLAMCSVCAAQSQNPTPQETERVGIPASRRLDIDTARVWIDRHNDFKLIHTNNRKQGISTTFDKEKLIALLGLPGVAGVKIYYGQDDKLSKKYLRAQQSQTPQQNEGKRIEKDKKDAVVILTPVDAKGEDLVNKDKNVQGIYYILTSPTRCPNDCLGNELD